MTTQQPEALRLADKMSSYNLCSGYAWHCHKAAAELRRLHESNQELLEALKALIDADADADETDYISIIIWEQARAAIAKAEGEAK